MKFLAVLCLIGCFTLSNAALAPPVVDYSPFVPENQDSIRVANFNVENFFVSLGMGGANNMKELMWQEMKLAAAVNALNAHVVVLHEIMNDDYVSVKRLVAVINGWSNAYYKYVRPRDQAGTRIISAIIYRDNDVEQIGPPSLLHYEKFGKASSRDSIIQDFRFHGENFAVVSVHLKSKGLPCEEKYSDGYENEDSCGLVRLKHVQQLIQHLQLKDQRRGAPLNYILAGDFNAYAHERSIQHMQQSFVNTVGIHDYSMTYRGCKVNMDYIFISQRLAGKCSPAQIWHINSEPCSPVETHYGIARAGYKWAATVSNHELSVNNPFILAYLVARSSDHDPSFVSCQMGQAEDGEEKLGDVDSALRGADPLPQDNQLQPGESQDDMLRRIGILL